MIAFHGNLRKTPHKMHRIYDVERFSLRTYLSDPAN
jgi:hypothetical protein